MRRILQLAAIFITATTHAQITNPDILVPQPPTAAPHRRPAQVDDLQWMWAFTRPARPADLRTDPRFTAMLQREFKQPQAAWGDNQRLQDAIPVFLTKYGTLTTESNRYITLDGCVPRFCPAHGLLWFDLGTRHPLIIFAAVNWSTEAHSTDEAAASYDLWLFPNRAVEQLPLAFRSAVAHWDARLAAARRLVPHIRSAVLVQPDGTPQPVDPALTGANSLKPQPDKITPPDPE